ncbi:nucleoside hydrolase [Marinitenerispora sediminis]|uniref:Nucleoside hydrolase n=1 Tax=Marinitenerispora sediminis TaxID=1931232 RepID=A0A368SZJ4_9ACTN|nr:nucleoside hydrolase [Marinitenerispora sediminis]RCV47980.1 nucleoside hydrolase [Marinitenerispora sediminis]RCV48852.1 nucleoside hydrolase [Marinitenerispora sediminis]RCV51215.1 nucleoside hydrolase [Marinitenerispora sediminis]
MNVPLVVDTDTAQDDCVALLAALLDPRADLRAITMVAGNVGFDRQVRNAFLTLNAAGRLGEVPVHLGCRRPLVRPWESAENVHGDGVGGLDMDLTGCAPEEEHAVDALVRLAAQRPGELSVVAIGPLTNIAMAAAKDPDFPRNLRALYVMGGSNNGRGNITAAAEFNFYVDPEAAKTVFAAGFPVTVVPWDPVTLRQAVFGTERLAEISALGTPLAGFFTRVCAATLEFDRRVGIEGTTHPDSLTVALLLRPELLRRAAGYHVDVETAGELTRGYAAMSWGVHGRAANAAVVEEVDAAGFFGYLRDLLARPVVPSRPFAAPR